MSNWWGNQGLELRESDRAAWWSRLNVDNRFFHYVDWTDKNFPIVPIIDNFHGEEHGFLSNFFVFPVTIDGLEYASNEHYYQSKKPIDGAVDDEGQLWSEKIRLTTRPGAAKKLGRAPCPLKPDWDKIKFRIMKEALAAKFNGTSLETKLLATGDAYLVEGNVWKDNCWGICIRRDCTCGNPVGRNYLGVFLMELRAILRGEEI